jgi:isopentenyl diphosphate isomerase/L-lactate dehydrogenase-like FMN-dependent dehydrogenase
VPAADGASCRREPVARSGLPLTMARRAVDPPRVISIEDLRSLARRRLPDVVFDYVEGGAEGEVTLRENRRAFDAVTFRPRQAVVVPRGDLRTRVLGFDLAFPALLAPVGYSRLMHPSGELAAARAAGSAGTAYILSTVSGYPLEEVKAATSGPVWYQLYLVGGREAAEAGIGRARAAGFSALVITIDTPVVGMREAELRHGAVQLLGPNPMAKLPFLPQVLTHPGWFAGFLLDGGVHELPNIVIPARGRMALVDARMGLVRAAFSWEDMRWIREIWPGPIIFKGVLTGEDARRAVDEGAAAVVVSNHGGRQLDGAPASLRALVEVVGAVAGRAEVLIDSGIRRGTDIIKAICLGARAVLVGRAYVYGLAAAGEAGVARALQILRADLERTLALLGCPSISGLDRSYVDLPAEWKRSGSARNDCNAITTDDLCK